MTIVHEFIVKCVWKLFVRLRILGVYQATSLSKTPIPRKLFFIKIVDSGGKNTMPRTSITLCDLASYIIWSILSTYLNIN